METLEIIISYSVSVITIIAFLFQFHKTIMHKDASGISYISQTIISIAVVLWMFYAGGTKTIAPGIVNAAIMIPVLITLYNSLKDNGISKKVSIGLPIAIGIAGLGSLVFFVLGMVDVLTGDYLGVLALLGVYIGGTFSATAFIPQTFRTLRTKNVKSLSFGMTLSYTIAQVLWILLFTLIMIRAVNPSAVDTATNLWSIVTAVVPGVVQFSLLYAMIKWRDDEKIKKIK